MTGAASLKMIVWLALVLATAAFAQNAPRSVDAAALERFENALALARQNPAAAIEMFEALTREYPNWPEPYNNLAVLYADRGDEKKAEQALLAAMGTHPSYALVHKNLEALYAGMAGRAYRKALNDDAAGPAPPRLKLAQRVGAATLTADAGGMPPPTDEPSPEPAPEAAVKVAAAASASPEPEPVTPETADEARRTVLSTVASWLEAWSSQDVERYLSFYGHHFEPGKGMTRDDWAAIRRRRVAGPEFIQIDIQNPSVSFEADDRASVRFLQTYRSNTFDGQTIKTLRLSRGSNGWKIVREETGG
ncbi:MAG TPA: tetratricopeptide repeat protein [Gammaproteobacteria bacterium]|nr:tetratricopeptide repeat protein [Gammaproteobacteria bacterium]